MRYAMFILSLAAVSIALALSPTQAGEIPQTYLDADYKTCMQSSAGSGFSVDQQDVYCECVVDELAKMDLDTYSRGAAEIETNTMSAETKNRVLTIAYKCYAQVVD